MSAHAEYVITHEMPGLVEFKISGLSHEDMATILNGFRDTERGYREHFYSKFLTGASEQVAGRKDEAEIRTYLDHLQDTIYKLERIYDMGDAAAADYESTLPEVEEEMATR